MSLPPIPPLPEIPSELRNVEFLRTVAGDPEGRRQIEDSLAYFIELRSLLLSKALLCNEVIRNVEEALGGRLQ